MPRIWDCLNPNIRLKIAAQFRLKCLWTKDGELELEGPIGIEEEREELAKLQKMAPKHPRGEGLGS